MALAITGATGAYAQSSAVIRTPASQASPQMLGNSYPAYHFTDANAQVCSLRQSGPNDGPMAVLNGPSNSTSVLEFVAGGQQGETRLRLTQQNCIDLLQAITNFANTGVLS
jgi:hypothetical protein